MNDAAAGLFFCKGDYEAAEPLAKHGLVLYRELGDTNGIARSLEVLGKVYLGKSNFPAARLLLEEALALYKENRDEERVSSALFWLGYIGSQQGEFANACRLLEESLAISRKRDDKMGIAGTLIHLVDTLLAMSSIDDSTTIRSLLDESFVIFQELDDRQGIANYFALSGLVALKQNALESAHSLLEKSLILYREVEDRRNAAEVLSTLVRVNVQLKEYSLARTLSEESLTLAEAVGDKNLMAFSLEGMAMLFGASGELTLAAQLWGKAEALREIISAPIPPLWYLDHEQAVMVVRQQLGEKAFAVAWTQGRTTIPGETLISQRQNIISMATSLISPTAKNVKHPLTQPYPDNLTAREVEVLRLVAQALTDAQIAEQLIISPRTVNTHLTSIYGKIQVSSRSAATRYAIEHHLL